MPLRIPMHADPASLGRTHVLESRILHVVRTVQHVEIAIHIVDHWQHLAVMFFFSSRSRHTISLRDWSSDVCSSDLFFVSDLEAWQRADQAVQVAGLEE